MLSQKMVNRTRVEIVLEKDKAWAPLVVCQHPSESFQSLSVTSAKIHSFSFIPGPV